LGQGALSPIKTRYQNQGKQRERIRTGRTVPHVFRKCACLMPINGGGLMRMAILSAPAGRRIIQRKEGQGGKTS